IPVVRACPHIRSDFILHDPCGLPFRRNGCQDKTSSHRDPDFLPSSPSDHRLCIQSKSRSSLTGLIGIQILSQSFSKSSFSASFRLTAPSHHRSSLAFQHRDTDTHTHIHTHTCNSSSLTPSLIHCTTVTDCHALHPPGVSFSTSGSRCTSHRPFDPTAFQLDLSPALVSRSAEPRLPARRTSIPAFPFICAPPVVVVFIRQQQIFTEYLFVFACPTDYQSHCLGLDA
ncbi:hypothetical protein BCV70DRAFT_178672, partial [Testicularia cyperi]